MCSVLKYLRVIHQPSERVIQFYALFTGFADKPISRKMGCKCNLFIFNLLRFRELIGLQN